MSRSFHSRCATGTFFSVLFPIFCACGLPGFAQDAKPKNTIRGTVVNSVTHEPVGRALVYSPDNRFATMTDGEGHFEFILAEPEPQKTPETTSRYSTQDCISSEGGTSCTTYPLPSQTSNPPTMLSARKPGFVDDRRGPPNMQPVIAGKELTIAITPEALIVGRVTLPDSEASDAVPLELYRRDVMDGRAHWVSAGSTSTKSDGAFRFAELSAGKYKLLTREQQDRDPSTFDPRGQRYGFPPVYFPAASDFEAAGTIELAAGQVFQAEVSLVRQPYYLVKVPVANVAANNSMSVVVSPEGKSGPGYSLGYNDGDEMIEGTLPNGNYTLEARTWRQGPANMTGSVTIRVKGGPVEGPRMTMAPSGSIPVVVKEEFTSSEEGNSLRIHGGRNGLEANPKGPRRYLSVSLEPADDFGQRGGFGLRPPASPEDESLAFDNVSPGRYWLRAYSSRGFVASMTSGEIDLLHQPLVVGGGSTSPIEITLRDEQAQIDGTVEGASVPANPPEGSDGSLPRSRESSPHVYLVPLPDSSGDFRDLWVGPDGKFGPMELPPGTYRALAFDRPQPELEYRNPEAMRAYEAKGEVVRVVAGQMEHLNLRLVSKSE